MNRNAFSPLALAFLATSVLAQQAPGEFRSEPPLQPAPPAEFRRHNSPATETEISRLKALVASQEKKISLLEAKIKLLEAELQNQRGTNR